MYIYCPTLNLRGAVPSSQPPPPHPFPTSGSSHSPCTNHQPHPDPIHPSHRPILSQRPPTFKSRRSPSSTSSPPSPSPGSQRARALCCSLRQPPPEHSHPSAIVERWLCPTLTSRPAPRPASLLSFLSFFLSNLSPSLPWMTSGDPSDALAPGPQAFAGI